MIAPATGYPTPDVRRILVPSAAAFLLQKILIHEKRDPDKRAKDILYIHDTIETFGGNLAAIREQWQTNVRPPLHAKSAHVVERAAEEYFREVDDTIREAARIATGRNLTPEMVRELCAYGLAVDFFVREPLGLIRGDGRTMEDEKTEMREYRFLFDNDNHAG